MRRGGSPDSVSAAPFSGPAARVCMQRPMLSSPPIPLRGARTILPTSRNDLPEHRSAALFCRWPWFHPLCIRGMAADAGRFALHLMLFRCLAWLGAVLAIVVAGMMPAFAQDADTVTLNFVNADIDAVVKAVGE